MTFSLFWMLNQLAPTSLDVGVGLLSGPDRMEADIDWKDGTTSRVVMNRDYAIEHIYTVSGEYVVGVTAVSDSTVQTISVFPGVLTLQITAAPDNPMSAWAQTTGAFGTMNVDWGDGTTSDVAGTDLNAGLVNHLYTTVGNWTVDVGPSGWPEINGPLAHASFSSVTGVPVLSGVNPSSVYIGSTITVGGTNLATIQHLWVGGTDCLVPGWSVGPSSVTTPIPSFCSGLIGKGPQDITIANSAGTATLPLALTITG